MAYPHCPHCLLPLAEADRLPDPPAAMRCPHCRLIIGAGRARNEADDDGDARSRGSAAGVLANAARRAHSVPAGRDDIATALRATAETLGCAVERLRMLDYQDACHQDPALPDLSGVLATYGTWKAARVAAAAQAPVSAAALDGSVVELDDDDEQVSVG